MVQVHSFNRDLRFSKDSGSSYKKVPRGYDPAHPNAAFLLYNGLYAGIETKIPKELYSAKLLDRCYARYREMAPLHRWLVEVMA